MEKFSKNKKRGRPEKFGEEKSFMRSLHPEGGNRTLMNRIYAQHAYNWLFEDPEFSWLFELRKDGNWKRFTLQVEVGRLGNPELARRVAAELCKLKPKVKDGVILLRRFRVERSDVEVEGDLDVLEDEIARTIDYFVMRYPGVSNRDILSVLRRVIRLFE